MQCERAREFFSDYVEQVLDRPMRVAVEAHVGACGDCREDLARMAALYRAFDAIAPVEPPADGASRVIRHLQQVRWEEQQAARSRGGMLGWLRSLRPASVAFGAALATLVVGGTVLLNRTGNHTQLTASPLPITPQTVSVAPAVGVRISVRPEAPSAGGRRAQVQVVSSTDLARAQVQVAGADVSSSPSVVGDLVANRPATLAVQVPGTQPASSFWVRVDAPALATPIITLVVLAAQPARPQPITLAAAYQEPSSVLLKLAPQVAKPILVDGTLNAKVTLQVADQSARRCLELVAEQLGAHLQEDEDAIRILPQ